MQTKRMKRREFLQKSAATGILAATTAIVSARTSHAQGGVQESPYRVFLPLISDTQAAKPVLDANLLKDPAFLQAIEQLSYPIQTFEELSQTLGGQETSIRIQNLEMQVQDLLPLFPAEHFPLISAEDLLAKVKASITRFGSQDTSVSSLITVYFYVYQSGNYSVGISNARFSWISGSVTNLGRGWYKVQNMLDYESQFTVSASGYKDRNIFGYCYYGPCYYHNGQYQISLSKGGGW